MRSSWATTTGETSSALRTPVSVRFFSNRLCRSHGATTLRFRILLASSRCLPRHPYDQNAGSASWHGLQPAAAGVGSKHNIKMSEALCRPFYAEYAWAFDLLIDRPVEKECGVMAAWLVGRQILPGA